jgi:hypothetical protein
MNGQPTAILMAVESTRRNMHEPPRERTARRPRRATARALQAIAVRLDPAVVQTPQLS